MHIELLSMYVLHIYLQATTTMTSIFTKTYSVDFKQNYVPKWCHQMLREIHVVWQELWII